jgi:hypothetical protein
LESVARDDNVFLVGGHSLKGTQLIVKLHAVFGVEISLASLVDHPTVGGISAEIEQPTDPAGLESPQACKG